jgi:cell wall-associated NlpC family hydrolase
MKLKHINKTLSEPKVSIASRKDDKDFSSLRKEIVAYALQFEGNPYVYGGTSLTKGTDCSGFTQSVFKSRGIKLPRTSREQAKGGKSVPLDHIQPGDLIFYTKNGRINHVALYIGKKEIIHASNPKAGIKISKYDYREPYKAVSYLD